MEMLNPSLETVPTHHIKTTKHHTKIRTRLTLDAFAFWFALADKDVKT